MQNNLPVFRITPSARLDLILTHMLRGESPMDARVSAHKAPLFTLTTEEKNFELRELGQYLFLVLAEHSDDLLFLGELCGVTPRESGQSYLNYAEFFYKLDNKQEIEFMAESSSADHMITRFKLLAIIDALFSIAKLSVVQSSFNSRIDLNGYTFIETSLLMRDLSIIHYADKLKDKPKFNRKDGVHDERFSRFSSERQGVLKSIIEKFSGGDKNRFAEMIKNALFSQEKEMNARFKEIVDNLFEQHHKMQDELQQKEKSEQARKGPEAKAYIDNLATAIFNFITMTPCGNQEKFKRLFGEVYSDKNPYKLGKNEYFVDSENYEFRRKWIDFTKHEREEVVPQRSFDVAFKRALKRLLEEA